MDSFKKKLDRVRAFFEKYERHLSSIALVCGFTFDYFTLTRIDQLYDNLVFIFYLSVVAVIILFLNAYEVGLLRRKIFRSVHAFTPIIMQFALGGLFSGFSIFYSRSASFSGSIVFFAVMFALLIGNEFFREKYKRFVFQMSIFFFALYSYAIFAVPVVFGTIGREIFLLSGVISLIAISMFALLFFLLTPERFNLSKIYLIRSIIAITIGINLLYFLNIVPPIPLAIKSEGVYHDIRRTETGDYLVRYQSRAWNEIFLPYRIFRSTPGDAVYVFTSVFSPTKFNTPIVHHWQYFDPERRRWISLGKIEFSTVGGRDGGYRGYSRKSAIVPGRWRVDVETKQGQVIGRIPFEIERVAEKVELKEKTI